MYRRQFLRTIGATAAGISMTASVAKAEDNGGIQPVGGELPNENAPNASLNALPGGGGEREVGQFLTLKNGWIPEEKYFDKTIELLSKSRHTFTYEDQTFILEGVDDWEKDGFGEGTFAFTHTDPPYPKGTLVDVSWAMVMTDDFYDNQEDVQYHAGDIFRPNIFPSSSTYEIVEKHQ